MTIKRYLANFKTEIEERLQRIYDGFITLKNEGLLWMHSTGSGYLSYYKN